MAGFKVDDLKMIVKTKDQISFDFNPLDIIPRMFFSCIEYIAKFVTYLAEYMQYNYASDNNTIIC